MTALTVARLSAKEAVSRKLLLAGVLLSVAFVALFALGFTVLHSRVSAGGDQLETVVAGGVLTSLGLYIVQFLVAFLAMFLAIGAVSSEIDSGQVHAVLARPLSRRRWYAERWLAFAAAVAVYSVVMAGALLAVARVVAGYSALDPARAIALVVLEGLVLLTIGMLGSAWLPTLANGVVVFSAFGLAWLAGIIEFAGAVVANATMETIGIAVSLLVPSDALWRGASYYLLSPALLTGVSATEFGGSPFSATTPPSLWLVGWAVAYVAIAFVLGARRLQRRDL